MQRTIQRGIFEAYSVPMIETRFKLAIVENSDPAGWNKSLRPLFFVFRVISHSADKALRPFLLRAGHEIVVAGFLDSLRCTEPVCVGDNREGDGFAGDCGQFRGHYAR